VRILALDWGSVRIGAAISDPDGRIAFPVDKFIPPASALQEIKSLVEELKVELILIGFPKTLAGQEGSSSKKVEEFMHAIKAEVDCPVDLIDERFSSVQAGSLLSESGINQKEQRALKDNIAAQIILQQYLDTKNKEPIK